MYIKSYLKKQVVLIQVKIKTTPTPTAKVGLQTDQTLTLLKSKPMRPLKGDKYYMKLIQYLT